MKVALDLGCSEFRSLRSEEGRLVARRVPAVYAVLEDLPAHRRLLTGARLPYSSSGSSLIVIGEPALELAETLNRPAVPLLPEARLPVEDPISRQVGVSIIESLLTPAGGREALCVMTSPPQPAAFFEHVVRLRGYRTQLLHASTALALAEQQQAEFSGACLTFGAELVTLSITHLGQPVWEFTSPGGAREIEEAFAAERQRYLWDPQGNRYLDSSSVRKWLRGGVSLAPPRDGDGQWLAEAFRRRLTQFWSQVRVQLLRDAPATPARPLPLVISGGAVRLHGFVDLAVQTLQQSQVPLRVSDSRAATFDPYSVARGLLVYATLHGHASAA